MDIITLLPGDKRLKQLIKEHGPRWVVVKIGSPACLKDTGAFISTKNNKHSRWVDIKDIEYDPIELELLPEFLKDKPDR